MVKERGSEQQGVRKLSRERKGERMIDGEQAIEQRTMEKKCEG